MRALRCQTGSVWRSRPGSDPGLRGRLAYVDIEGVEDLLELLRTGAA